MFSDYMPQHSQQRLYRSKVDVDSALSKYSCCGNAKTKIRKFFRKNSNCSAWITNHGSGSWLQQPYYRCFLRSLDALISPRANHIFVSDCNPNGAHRFFGCTLPDHSNTGYGHTHTIIIRFQQNPEPFFDYLLVYRPVAVRVSALHPTTAVVSHCCKKT